MIRQAFRVLFKYPGFTLVAVITLLMHPQLAQSKFIEQRSDRFVQLLARVKPEVSTARAESSFDLLAQQIKEAKALRYE